MLLTDMLCVLIVCLLVSLQNVSEREIMLCYVLCYQLHGSIVVTIFVIM